jgi:uncharacterized protein (UPF0276 family)
MINHNGTAHAPDTPTGIGLRAPHVAEIMASRPELGFLEVHAENYMANGPALEDLLQLRDHYPISLHGVGLSLGSADGLSRAHLNRLQMLVEEIRPRFVSEHLSWSVVGGTYLNDLIPLPYTREALAVVSRHIDHVQQKLGRRLLIENSSSYLRYRSSMMTEVEFLAELVRWTGCGILCDVNNVFVTTQNLRLDASSYLRSLPADAIGEIHLAGHAANDADGMTILIDDHGAPVCEAVWTLYGEALRRFGPVPALVEWDTNIPDLSVLIGQARIADTLARAATLASGDHHARAA